MVPELEGASAAEGILSPQIQFASPEPTASASQVCKAASGLFQRDSVVSGWLGMGVVDDDGGIPGSFPPAGRLPSPALAGARDAPCPDHDAANRSTATLILRIPDISSVLLNHSAGRPM